jgi:hypothetical protein
VHWLAEHPTLPAATWGNVEQSLVHEPHVRSSVGEKHEPGAPHVSWPEGQTQAPHWQLSPQVCFPAAPQLWVTPGMHGPSPVHAPHGPQLPSAQVRACVPHWPHDWVPPLGSHEPPMVGLPPFVGSGVGVETDAHGPHAVASPCV